MKTFIIPFALVQGTQVTPNFLIINANSLDEAVDIAETQLDNMDNIPVTWDCNSGDEEFYVINELASTEI